MAGYSSYPVDLVGEYEERVNRVLWLIKWLLLIPHLVVLSLLQFPTIFTVPLSWLIILIIGRNPEFLWGYHSGLLRWSWRVNYYAYGVGNTDRYPPFSFSSREDYPADLLIEYPERSSRLTTLFRWLLIIPHWIIVYFLGMITGVLVLVALVLVLITGRYSESLFDIIMQLNLWQYRVSAYGMLLVDEYPPFSFE